VDVTEWEPATDAEVAMRDALRTDDQESYFRILAGVDLLLPVSADALAGLAPLGWGTWSTGGRTHVLAFTSPSALQACLADYTGSARRVAYGELAETWPNLEWWLAVNPGLPIEGYLPAWFVAQLSRGDLRLPTRGPARETSAVEQSPQDLQAAAMAANAAATRAAAGPPMSEAGAAADPASSGYHADQPGYDAQPGHRTAQQVGPGGLPVRTPGAVLPSGLPSRVPSTSDSEASAPSWSAFSGASTGEGGSSPSGPGQGQPGPGQPGPGQPGPGQPGAGQAAANWPTRSPSGDTAAPVGPGQAAANWPKRSPGAGPASGGTGFGGPTSGAPTSSVPAAYNAPGVPGATQPGPGQASLDDPRGTLPTRTPMAQTPPLPNHLQPPAESAYSDAPASTGGLPRRQVTPPEERPPSMAAAAQALAGSRSPQPTSSPPSGPYGQSPSQGMSPPVIPGSGGAGRGPSGPPLVPSAAARPSIPPSEPPARPDPEPAPEDEFVPANDVERDLLDAAGGGSTDQFLSTLLLATILVPVADNSRPGSAPGESGFAFRTEEIDGDRFLVVFTSRDRLAEHFAAPTRTVGVRFYELIKNWPDPAWSFAVNPESPVGAKYPGPQVIALAAWATEAGLGQDPAEPDDRIDVPVPAPQRATDAGQQATVMQKAVPPEHVDYYLERGYDRVAGFVHRANEVEHLHTPGELFSALGLAYDGSAFTADAKEAHVLRWPAYRPSLYRIPYGGQSEQALRAMDGWVIERPPFRGNGFAPGEGRDVIAEFKVDSVRLPHGAQLWRMDADGTEKMVAIFDADVPVWRRVGEQ
jgi:hypothetical protein